MISISAATSAPLTFTVTPFHGSRWDEARVDLEKPHLHISGDSWAPAQYGWQNYALASHR